MAGKGVTLNFMIVPACLEIYILEPWRVCSKRVGGGPLRAALQGEEGGRGQCGAPGAACKGLSENRLCPDSHASSQPPCTLCPEFGGPRDTGGVGEGLAGSEVMASSGGSQAGRRGSKEHVFGSKRASGWEAGGPSQPCPISNSPCDHGQVTLPLGVPMS